MRSFSWRKKSPFSPEKIKQQLKELKSFGHEDYQKKVGEVSRNMDRYLSYQKKICLGEFSTLVFEEKKKGKAQEVMKNLSRQERDICLRSLIEIQRKYIEISFNKRAEFFEFIHRERMENLREQKKKAMEELRTSKKKKGRSARQYRKF